MLKKKLKKLIENQSLNQKDLVFEVISDSSAVSLNGGTQCVKLEDCGTYFGGCPSLVWCSVYTCTEFE
jgi:hypothetical protein